ncbi:luciferase-like monooxygenase [Aeromonas caviae]|jgi:luciferase family oxidoreductase group 1|uniref:Luciferase-like monooxygenase n=1 Tax=Aeromonas caviae TaxID=648 RepID=A0A125Y714_AERCA|nr:MULTISPECIES: luciferase-like monooxygenase [Aeromonas]TXH93317.1 MAG: luciferase-like monooxygenase [Pseudorhodobacter sp.]AUU22093.1 LLM class flavin-dependent oxidoreductase [Aeromonas caviae]AUV13843.1 LLM class flavin-dependent oxidoreductase [Aeromonas sp. ASNIH3]AUY09130.1 LLM class flavin-dependent oxidoreductase [Aeromonas sp. ASNIH2]AXB01381.1 luciferase-like monooxygenase [Aeromonas caviae]
MSVVPYSVLDLVPVPEGGLPAESFRHSLDLARHAERWGYHRYWLAEHHNMPGIASAATAVLIGHLAGGTTTLRLGAGGIMLPNHSPLVIAEQFGTLSSLYPDRIDLGLGRAPGSDQRTMQALRRQRSGEVDDFPADVRELMSYFGDEVGAVQAVPGQGLHVPIWLLGSSLYSAQLAAAMGLPFGFASHFAPAMLLQALEIYRTQYRPSARWPKPHAVVCVNLIAADTDREARFLFTTLQQQFLRLYRGDAGKLPLPVQTLGDEWSPRELMAMEQTLARSLVGEPDRVRHGLKALLAETGADELMFNGPIVDHQARLRSFEIGAELMQGL